jgi:hypothetical protein
MSARELRPELLKQCDILQALLAFNYGLTEDVKADLALTRARIPTATSKQLKDIRDILRDNVRNCARRFGSKYKLDMFAAEFIASGLKGSAIPVVSKAVIDEMYFDSFAGGNATWKEFPSHLLLQVHFDWIVPDGGPFQFHYWLPEALLYEDMAMSYNTAVETLPLRNKARGAGANIDVKKHNLHLRTAILSAYYFVEAYLNGIAFDYYTRHGAKLDSKDRDLIMEWDTARNRQQFVSFEKKISAYPKIMLGSAHPPLTVTSSPHLKILLGQAKELRDAIVHQSPKTTSLTDHSKKVQLLFDINLPSATEIVDAAIGFVRQINNLLGKEGMFLDWLFDRDMKAGGMFPPEAFK